MEGRRTRESDDMLRPCIRITDEASYHTDLTDYISRLGQIHEEQPELHMGRYQELTLTNRQYSFARHGDHSCVITAVNNDENPGVHGHSGSTPRFHRGKSPGSHRDPDPEWTDTHHASGWSGGHSENQGGIMYGT